MISRDTIPEKFLQPPTPGVVRVLQTSDWHVGGLPSMAIPERAQQRKELLLSYVESLPQLAHDCSVDVVLLPGDLFQNEDVSNSDVDRTMTAIRAFAPIPVIIAAGNHDPLDALSQYRRRLQLHNAESTSSNIYIAESKWQRFEFEKFAVTSRSFVSQAVKHDSPFADLPPRPTKPVELLCLHASVGEPIEGQVSTAPVTEAEIVAAGYDYAAFGHYHSGRDYRNSEGKIIAGYSGCLAIIRKSDKGKSDGIILCDIEPGGVTTDSYVRMKIDPARMLSISIPDEPTNTALLESVKRAFTAKKVMANDFVTITVTGRALSQRRGFPAPEMLSNLCFAHEWIDATVPEWDWEQLSSGATIEARFVRELRERILNTLTTRDEESAVLLNDALDLALQALQEKEIKRLPPSISRTQIP